MHIPVQNCTNESIRLGQGEILGQLQHVTLEEDAECIAEKLSDVVVAGINDGGNENTCKVKKSESL